METKKGGVSQGMENTVKVSNSHIAVALLLTIACLNM